MVLNNVSCTEGILCLRVIELALLYWEICCLELTKAAQKLQEGVKPAAVKIKMLKENELHLML